MWSPCSAGMVTLRTGQQSGAAPCRGSDGFNFPFFPSLKSTLCAVQVHTRPPLAFSSLRVAVSAATDGVQDAAERSERANRRRLVSAATASQKRRGERRGLTLMARGFAVMLPVLHSLTLTSSPSTPHLHTFYSSPSPSTPHLLTLNSSPPNVLLLTFLPSPQHLHLLTLTSSPSTPHLHTFTSSPSPPHPHLHSLTSKPSTLTP
ncbi:unnamed protein product [Pleuronectes platessa]|uniref:Uncharacterized protein n=1 Tax=Pleuronectes platessa TaxID=8262 RepID=A0A9N7Y4W4_PLEPL|nr:unnamed protein product [Pleuronectes platessa]